VESARRATSTEQERRADELVIAVLGHDCATPLSSVSAGEQALKKI